MVSGNFLLMDLADGTYNCLMGSLIVDYFEDGTSRKYFKDDENKRNSQSLNINIFI